MLLLLYVLNVLMLFNIYRNISVCVWFLHMNDTARVNTLFDMRYNFTIKERPH